MNAHHAFARSARWVAALSLTALLGACSTDPAPADAAPDQTPVDVADVADVADANDASPVSDASDGGDASDAPLALPRCEFPDGGASMAMIASGRNTALALCTFCHQDAMPGAGEFSGQTFPRPRTTAYGANLTPDLATGIGRRTDEQVMRSIRYDLSADGTRSLCAMAAFGAAQLNDENLCALLAYLRSLPPVARAIPASTCAP